MFSADLGVTPSSANYIEDVFSTYLYTGNSSTQTITNGIDLSTKGGLVWMKSRTFALDHQLYDTARGTGKLLYSNLTNAEATVGTGLTAFTTSGFTIGSSSGINGSSSTYASWTFREQAKFFDVVTYTGNGVSGRTINHNLGSVPGCIIVKCTSQATAWAVYHRSLNIAGGHALMLNVTDASASLPTFFNSTTATSTAFTVGNAQATNQNTSTYVAYLFAHDAGGFGATGSDNVISCGSYTTNGSGVASVTLGYEPQWILWKRSDSTADWYIFDTMRGWTGDPANFSAGLRPNLSNAENSLSGYAVNSTGFNVTAGAASATYIYIAIRRGPMKTPTTGTSVFYPLARTGTGSSVTLSGFGFPPDTQFVQPRNVLNFDQQVNDRLRGCPRFLTTQDTSAENTTSSGTISSFNQDGISIATGNERQNNSTTTYINYFFRRAPGFFDVVCYTGNGTTQSISHNLGVTPELVIVKNRSNSVNWVARSTGFSFAEFLNLNSTAAKQSDVGLGVGAWGSSTQNFSSSVFYVGYFAGASFNTNESGLTYVAYLFATVAGVSKVGSYTGTGTTKQIDCGFTGGARFVLIKRTNSTGDWYVWDSARGIVAGNDPYLLLNSTAAEVTSTDYVDTYSAGFEISSTAPAAINANGGTFIFLAIA